VSDPILLHDPILLQEIWQRATENENGKNVYAAGGVRGLGDLMLLKKLGVKGALIASALHLQQITTDELKSLSA
jgi:uncharacterized protein related to proFAR isomerase